jgi:hemerythrin-like domain-containing protein
VFQALKDQGDFAEAVVDLEGEHADFDEAISDLGLDQADLEAKVADLLGHLTLHIDKENLGIFPIATVTLGSSGWDTVATAHHSHDHKHTHEHHHASTSA